MAELKKATTWMDFVVFKLYQEWEQAQIASIFPDLVKFQSDIKQSKSNAGTQDINQGTDPLQR